MDLKLERSKKMKIISYYEWTKNQPDAIEEIKEYGRLAKVIPDKKNRMKYLEKSKRYFNRKWTQRYSEYKKCSKK
jgi:hypothetical protein